MNNSTPEKRIPGLGPKRKPIEKINKTTKQKGLRNNPKEHTSGKEKGTRTREVGEITADQSTKLFSGLKLRCSRAGLQNWTEKGY